MGKGVTIRRAVGQFDAFAQRGKVGRVEADLVAHAQGVHADITALTNGIVAVTVTDEAVVTLASGLED